MKYHTKKFYALNQSIFYDFEPLPGDDTSIEAITGLYHKAMEEFIRNDRQEYNTPPSAFNPDTDSGIELSEGCIIPDLPFGDFNHWDYLLTENEGAQIWHHPYEPEEAQAVAHRTLEEEMRLFETRPTFNPEAAAELYGDMFESDVANCESLPEWLLEKIDIRIPALGYLPSDLLKEYRTYRKKTHKFLDNIEKKGARVLSQQNIPDKIENIFYLHDAYLLKIENEKSNLILTFAPDGDAFDDDEKYRIVRFRNATVIEKDESIAPEPYENQYCGGCLCSDCQYLEEELYRKGGRYEIHMLFDCLGTASHYAYFTVGCDGVEEIK